MYGVVRNAMMPRRIKGEQTALYDALRTEHIDRRSATRLQNYYTHLGYTEWTIDNTAGGGLVILTTDYGEQQAGEVAIRLSKSSDATLCILHPNKSRRAMARSLVAEHQSMSASKRSFTLLVYGKCLPRQHIIL